MSIRAGACELVVHRGGLPGLAHYHFHAQRYDNASWAGPGMGDLVIANTHHASAIAFTFLDPRTLNVDVYFPGRIIIDLGCLTH